MLGQVLGTYCNIKMGIDKFATEKCKVTFGFKYVLCFVFVQPNTPLVSVPSYTVSHFSYAPLFKGPHFFHKNAGFEHSL